MAARWMAGRAAWVAALAVFVSDQVTKWLVVHWLDLQTRLVIEVAPPFLVLRMAWNRGVNFGLFASGSDLARWALIALAVAIAAWVWWTFARATQGRMMQVSAGILVGGALGNVVDRVLYGAVADFLNMSCCGFSNPYAFNIADIAIFVGVVGLAFAPHRHNTP